MQVRRPSPSPHAAHRRGLTTPMIAIALLVAMLGLALILDRLWLEATRLELTIAAESAAISGARELASDALLIPAGDASVMEDEAVQAALMTAVQNRAAGQPVLIDEHDVILKPGDQYEDVDAATEEPTSLTTVIVTARRTRFRGNPVALFLGELTGQPFGDAAGQAGASIDNHVAGIRPLTGSVVPALPLALWKADPSGQRSDTWQVAIEQRRGRDDYGYDEQARSVTTGPDGIPELTLRTIRRGGSPTEANVQLVDIGSQFQDERLQRQILDGWGPEDLEAWGGELRLAPPQTAADAATGSESGLPLRGIPQLEQADRQALESVLGEKRIVLLYSSAVPVQGTPVQTVDCVELVAIRVLNVLDQNDGSCRVIVQPTVVATRTALVETGEKLGSRRNPYIYNLRLTQ